ncbi:hypothetical protein PTTG_12586 [Puccinia triticina 1-1 BBBD Race 1]|uniref:Uncharacterized protein n=1 Tax=Puccinia triticina (isolate 1-1 / race 1 (BBBD)) TaxID=630390 RepID=A0A180GS58_PUCT1|nr:hypothetical protein PTTG_12586 [Puccinia triticina 1-1 BBBD Race 1]
MSNGLDIDEPIGLLDIDEPSGLVDIYETDTIVTHRFRNQVEFAAKGLARLANHDYTLGLYNTPADLSINRLRSKKYLLTELHSNLLPVLRQQIISLSQALGDSNSLRLNPAPTLKLVIAIQPKLELTLHRIIRAIKDLIPGMVYESTLTNDQHFKELKRYRLRGLDCFIKDVLRTHLNSFFLNCRRLIETLILPAGDQTDVQALFIGELLQSIDSVVTWSHGSELHQISDQWKLSANHLNFLLNNAFFLAEPNQGSYTGSVIELTKSFIPVIKLSKLFFNKMTTGGMAKNKLPIFTEMSSHQLRSLDESVEEIKNYTGGLMYLLPLAVEDQQVPTITLGDNIEKLSACFQSCLFLIDLYILPRCVETNSCSSQTCLRTWLVTWRTLFSQATINATEACESYEAE